MAKCKALSEFKSLGVLLNQQLSFQKHTTPVAKACNYHIQAIRHVRPLLTRDVAETLTCSLVNNRLDYCNSLLYGAPVSSINKLQQVLNNDAHVVSQSRQCRCTYRCTASAGITALAACAAAHHIQVGISNLQDRQDIISIIPECTPDSCCA